MPGQINDNALELGPCNLYVNQRARGSLTIGGLIFKARKGGVAGNSITIALTADAAATDPIVKVTATPTGQAIEVKAASATTEKEIHDAVNGDFAAFSLVYAVYDEGEDGSSAFTPGAAAPLTGGADAGIETFLGALGDQTAVNISATASPLTAAQSGTQARDKVITGGSFQIAAPLKEITLENFALAFPNAILIEGTDGRRRLDFVVRVGESLRKSRGTTLVLKKIIGGVESSNPDDILTVPEASPVDAQVSLTFSPTEQRVLAAVFEAWPDGRGVLAFFGTEEV